MPIKDILEIISAVGGIITGLFGIAFGKYHKKEKHKIINELVKENKKEIENEKQK